MKLSQKLLALGGVTLADYACCPYDDYGMPHDKCTTALPEKTPFSLESDWRNGACKAWESNVDATYDGNDQSCGTNENWGSCGFQRHFPWNEVDTRILRNRGCVITKDADAGTFDALPDDNTCNCEGYGDETGTNGAIVCKAKNVIAGSNPAVTSNTCDTYSPATHSGLIDLVDFENGSGGQFTNGICCDPSQDHIHTDATLDGNGDPVTHTISCVTTCDDTYVDQLNVKPKCYETDFLGRRNIQAQKLHLDSALTYSTASVGSFGFSYDAVPNSSTGTPSVNNANLYNLAGVPFLGGICKLFVPVPRTRITSVQIAGVHVSLQGQSVFSAKVDADGQGGYTSGEDVGTAYCFSVVNPAEGLKNSNGIHNGNVAGGTLGANAIFDAMVMSGTSLERQAGIEPEINFFDGSDANNIGTQLQENSSGTNSAAAGEADSEVGANFDVVVHIHSEWCNSPSFWNVADMQLTGDYNNGNEDYPLNSQPFTAQASRTDTKYSAAQIAKLPIKQRFDAIETANTDQAATNLAFTNAVAADLCYQAAVNTCQTELDNYFNAVKDAAECAADSSRNADCSTEVAAVGTTKDLLYTVTAGTPSVFTGGCLNNGGTPFGDCNLTDGSSEVNEMVTLAGLATAWGTDAGQYNSAVYAYNADLANSFTHAHMDIMDKRHNQVATFNNVYQADPDNSGYLRFPHADDEAFKGHDGNANPARYTASASYLRWPNAGAFAAFYSFVTCANPPYIAGDASAAADVNPYSIIYNNGASPSAPASAEQAYSHLGETILRSRTLVMSQSDSDYRDENCQAREFRGNVRQVGNTVTHCGPGQLPDTDNKRCSWNWNYNSHSYSGTESGGAAWNAPSPQNPLDAEEWFDRNDPHSFDMWSTRKRRAVANDRKYAFNMGYWGIQEDEAGTATKGFNAVPFNSEDQLHADAIQIPITDYNFNLIFKNADDLVPPLTVITNTDLCFDPSNTAGCTACKPSALEFNLAGYVKDDAGTATAVTIDANNYATDVANLPTLYHLTNCGGANHVIDSVTYKTCDMSIMKDSSHLGSTQVCDSNNGNSYEAASGKGGFRQLTNPQTLTFDDSRIKSALNPTNKKWEVSVQCQKVNMQALSGSQAQRDFFPDCFFGDEIWFTFTYGSDLVGAYQASPAISTPYNLAYNTYVSSWFSSVEVDAVSQSYITASQFL